MTFAEVPKLAIQVGGTPSDFVYGATDATGGATTMCKYFYDPDASCGPQTVPVADALTKYSCQNITPPEMRYIAATIRKLETNIYFVGTYNGAPALMMLTLGPTGFTLQPLVEGIEDMQVEYGIDTDASGRDGSPDVWKDSPEFNNVATTPASNDWQNVVAVRVHLLARTLDRGPANQPDNKTYTLGTKTVTINAPGDGYKRHVFTSTIVLKNMIDRRTLPPPT